MARAAAVTIAEVRHAVTIVLLSRVLVRQAVTASLPMTLVPSACSRANSSTPIDPTAAVRSSRRSTARMTVAIVTAVASAST